jgi:hypothetical protein
VHKAKSEGKELFGKPSCRLRWRYNIKTDVKSGWSVVVYWNILAEGKEKWQ